MAPVVVVYFWLESGYSNGYFSVAKMKEKCPIVSSTSKGISHFPSHKKERTKVKCRIFRAIKKDK